MDGREGGRESSNEGLPKTVQTFNFRLPKVKSLLSSGAISKTVKIIEFSLLFFCRAPSVPGVGQRQVRGLPRARVRGRQDVPGEVRGRRRRVERQPGMLQRHLGQDGQEEEEERAGRRRWRTYGYDDGELMIMFFLSEKRFLCPIPAYKCRSPLQISNLFHLKNWESSFLHPVPIRNVIVHEEDPFSFPLPLCRRLRGVNLSTPHHHNVFTLAEMDS